MSKLTAEILEDDNLFWNFVLDELIEAVIATPEYQEMMAEWEDEVINGTGEAPKPLGIIKARKSQWHN